MHMSNKCIIILLLLSQTISVFSRTQVIMYHNTTTPVNQVSAISSTILTFHLIIYCEFLAVSNFVVWHGHTFDNDFLL